MTDFWAFYTKVRERHCAHIQINIKGPSIFRICVAILDQEEEVLLQILFVGDNVGFKTPTMCLTRKSTKLASDIACW